MTLTRRIKFSALVSLLALLLLPALQLQYRFVREFDLFGVEEKAQSPSLSWPTWWSGKFQEKFDSWFSEKVGFRTYFIRSENELNLALFGDISSRSPSKIILGRDNYLYERGYISAALKPIKVGKAKLERSADKLKRLQSLLAARGIAFTLLISPNKANIYADHLPERYRLPDPTSPTDRAYFIQFLEERGVNYLDGSEIASQIRQGGLESFAKSGTHWSYATACLVSSRILADFEKQLGKNLVNIDCSDMSNVHQPKNHDTDLANLTNIWSPERYFLDPIPYPRSFGVRDGSEFRPKIIIVGSSFIWPVLYYFDRHKAFWKRSFFYYFRTDFKAPKVSRDNIDRAKLDWESRVFSRNLILLEINESALGQLGWGFVEDALKNLS